MKTPLPGQPVRSSTTGKPIMALLDLLGRRQALRILWELRDGGLKFRPLQTACQSSPSVLNARLKELRAANLIEHTDIGYDLTTSGRELSIHVVNLAIWAKEWAKFNKI